MVSTGGGDSPLLIRAGPWLLLMWHFSRGGAGVGLALLKLGAAARQSSTAEAAGCPACADVAGVEGLLCCTVRPCTLPGQGWKGSEFRLGWDRGEAAGLGSLQEIGAGSSVPATPDGACLDWAGWSCTGMMDKRQTPSRLCDGEVIGTFQARINCLDLFQVLPRSHEKLLIKHSGPEPRGCFSFYATDIPWHTLNPF